MTEAVQVALIVGISGAITSLIGSGAMIATTILGGRAQARHHQKHENVSSATNNAVNRLEIAVNGGLDERIDKIVKQALKERTQL